MKVDGTGSLTPEELRSRVVARLDQLGIKVSFPHDEEPPPPQPYDPNTPDPEVVFPYGKIVRIKAHGSPDVPELLVIAPVISTGAGVDTSLYLYRRRAQHWQQLLVDNDTADYEAISSQHEFALSPPDPKGNCFIVVAKMIGGLHGSLATLRYRVLRPGRSAHVPKTLLDHKKGARRLFEPCAIRTQADGFEIEFVTSAVDRKGEFDPESMIGTRLLRLKVGEDKVTLLARRQLKPHEFELPASADK
ncbi:MAG: hypothetical protein ABR589_07260 [Chthoniobacterales bacterium]